MDIRRLSQDTITDVDADEVARLRTLVDPRRLRTDPPVTRQLAVNELWPTVPTYATTYWGLFDGDVLAAMAETGGAVNAENADVCEVGIWTDPQRLGQGLNRVLFDHLDEVERAAGRTRYWGWGDLNDETTRAFWEDELGYTLAYDERISRCTFADVDEALMQQWIDQAQERAGGYHLEHAQAPFDDRLTAHFATALEAMNDAPLDDLEHEPETYDSERARELESLFLATRSDYQAIFAFETETDQLAGYTAVRIPHAEPALSKQGDTVTVSTHRNRGIGRWIKAEMWKWLRTERPQVESLSTGNAESNRAMLAINEAMGFRDVLHHGLWHDTT